MINSYLTDDLWTVISPVPPYDKYNKPNAPTVTAVKGFIEWKSTLVRNLSGEEVTSQASVLLNLDPDLGHPDKLRVTDPHTGDNIDWSIIAIKPAKGYYTAGMWYFL